MIDGFTTDKGLAFSKLEGKTFDREDYVCFDTNGAYFFQYEKNIDISKKTYSSLFSIISNPNNTSIGANGVGFFYKKEGLINEVRDLSQYKLSFIESNDKVIIQSEGDEVATISKADGFIITGGGTLGAKCLT